MVHVALGLLRSERIDLLGHLDHVQRGDTHDLGLAALEQRTAVCPRDDRDLGGERADIGDAATVDAEVVGQDALADQFLGQRAVGRTDLLLAPGEGLAEAPEHLNLDLIGAIVALGLAGNLQCGGKIVAGGRDHRGIDVIGVVREQRVVGDRLGSPLGQLLLGFAQRGDERLGRLKALRHNTFGGRGRATGDQVDDLVGRLGLHHHDRDVTVMDDAAGDDHVEHGALELLDGGESDPLILDQGHPNTSDRTGER